MGGFADGPEGETTAYRFYPTEFNLDLLIGLSVALALAFGVDRVVFRRIGPGFPTPGVTSLWFFVAGIAPLTVVAAYWGLGLIHYMNAYPWASVGIYLGLLPVTPLYFVVGARRSWRERKEHPRTARLSRWLNVLGLAGYLGLVVFAAFTYLTRWGW